MILTVAGLAVALSEERVPLLEAIERAPAWVVAGCLGMLLFVVELFAVDANIPFVYFQF
jgi:hypothetical protein